MCKNLKLWLKKILLLHKNALEPINLNKIFIFTQIQREKGNRSEHHQSKPKEHSSHTFKKKHIQTQQPTKSKKDSGTSKVGIHERLLVFIKSHTRFSKVKWSCYWYCQVMASVKNHKYKYPLKLLFFEIDSSKSRIYNCPYTKQ